ncbi:MAG: BlaI/MecI/CopY family transcriptional regulator [Gemmatimonadaceae bacterium]|nr:BlaI/MecI/CopY family transcriptional regulator [Gemmatimonadaceae bacterium]
MDDLTLGERELDVMAVLWELGDGTVGEVQKKLPADLAYTTVLTILRNLEAKGFVSHTVSGRAHRYQPRVAQRAAQQSALRRVLSRFFAGSPELLLARLVDDGGVDANELRDVAERLAKSKGKGRAR